MDLIINNPYRIAGILSNASEREQLKQKTRIKAFTKVGKEIKSEYDFNILEDITRTEDSVEKAFSNIQQNQDKVNHSLFWFLNVNPLDNTTIEYLKNGDRQKALEIWKKVTIDKNVTTKNYSAFNNLGTYYLLSKNKIDIKKGIEAKIKLIESDYYKIFIDSVADETYTIDQRKQSEKFIDALILQFQNHFSSTDSFQLFSGCNDTLQKYLSKKFTEEPTYKIESEIESCKNQRNINKINAYEFGLKLFTYTKDELTTLKSLLGTDDLKYKAIADQLANEIMQCGIDYFNQSKENNSNENYLESSQKLTRLADSIAIGKLTKDRAKDSLATLEEMQDSELNQAIAILSSIKLAYEKSIREIDAQVASMIVSMPYNQTINYSKVDKMKANCLDWSKVVEVIGDEISINDVAIIKRCSNQIKISEYKSLVDLIFSKLGPLQINQLKYICYWKDVRAVQAKSTAKKIGRTTVDTATTVNDASGGCFGEIFSRVLGFAILGFIIWLLSLIFG